MSDSTDHHDDARAQYRSIAESGPADYVIQGRHFARHLALLPDMYVRQLESLRSPHLGYPVDRYVHSLQTATRALRAGHDEEYVFVALFHDVGDVVAPTNHPEASAAMLRPYISDENYWLVRHHGAFQGHYYYHFIGRDRHLRERYRGHPCFERTALFCEKYDQESFDRDYDTLPLAAFLPIVRRVLARPARFVFE